MLGGGGHNLRRASPVENHGRGNFGFVHEMLGTVAKQMRDRGVAQEGYDEGVHRQREQRIFSALADDFVLVFG